MYYTTNYNFIKENKNLIDWSSFAKSRKYFPEFATITINLNRDSDEVEDWRNYFANYFKTTTVYFPFIVRIIHSTLITMGEDQLKKKIMLTLENDVFEEIQKQAEMKKTTVNLFINNEITKRFSNKIYVDYDTIIDFISKEIDKEEFGKSDFKISDIPGFDEQVKIIAEKYSQNERALRGRIGKHFNQLVSTNFIKNTIRATDENGELMYSSRCSLYRKTK